MEVTPLGDLGAGIGRPRWWRELVFCLGGLIVLGVVAWWLVPAPWRAAGPARIEQQDAAGQALTRMSDERPGVSRGEEAKPERTVEKAESVAAAPPRTEPPAAVLKPVRLRRGEALVDLLRRAGLSAADALAVVRAFSELADPRRLRAGAVFNLAFEGGDGTSGGRRLARLVYRPEPDYRLVVTAGGHGYEARRIPVPAHLVYGYARGRIADSLYLDAERAGVPVPLIVKTIRALGFAVDFERELWPGDEFEILYTKMLAEDGRQRPEAVLFVGLQLRGRSLAYYRFVVDGRADYFDARGRSIRRTLMKTPLDGARLTSRFGRRRHPILGYVTAHKGVDFGAPPGTPVYAAGDGIIERAGRYGGYGNYIRIRHNGTYATAYGHLKAFARGIRSGVRVRQGQVIGYVGATGRATGPHLHYEVLVNGRQVNPLTLKLPSGRALTGARRQAFARHRAEIDRMRMTLRHAESLLAAARTGRVEAAADAGVAAGLSPRR
ncbi:MAG: M23 family peptidase [Alphaproteobacteria bacterium]|nr:MAG: M23 family peptidase [Alphaproteobacteria bacterium]